MRRMPSLRRLAFLPALAWLALGLAIDGAPYAGDPPSSPRVAAVHASVDVDGEPAVVTVLLDVAPGEDPERAAREALLAADPGARLVDGEATIELPFNMTGIVWSAFPVVVNYNDGGAPNTGPGGRAARLEALRNAIATWNAVPTSFFEFAYGTATTRCPSLADACPGPKRFDGNNDVGWIDLTDRRVLASTTSGLRRNEFDMVINRRAGRWYAGPLESAPTGGWIDLETVLLHELGHALGLDHSATTDAVMYAAYLGVRRALRLDDVYGVTILYPAPEPAPSAPPAASATPSAPTSPGVPAAPASLVASSAGPRTVRLSWQDRSDNETEFRIERSSGGGAFTLVLRAAANTTSYGASGIPSGTYVYRVSACNAAGCSAPVSVTVDVR